MAVRAKFKVMKIEQSETQRDTGRISEAGRPIYEPGELRTIVLSPVFSNDPESENRKFWNASPSGEIRLGTVNQQAWEAFALGGEYYVDFTPAT